MSEDRDAAFTEALTGEYAAIYAYGIVGAQVTADERPAADAAITAHRAARDDLRTAMAELGIPAPPAEPAYATGEIDNPEAARALAVSVETALVPRYAELASQVSGEQRGWCATQAQQCATRTVSWGGPSQAFPGVTAGPAETQN